MKNLLIIIAIIYSSNAYSQTSDQFIYGEAGMGYGTHTSLKAGIAKVFNSDNVVSLCYYYNSRLAPGVPSDYHAGLFGSLPRQKLNMYCLMYGKMLRIPNSSIRGILKGGVGLGNARTPANFTDPGNTGIWYLGPAYNYTYHTVFNYGLVLNPAMEFPFSKGFGCSLGLFSIINPISTSAGIEANILFGNLGNKHRNNN